jgi:adenine-specific DNA-methyltransferase
VTGIDPLTIDFPGIKPVEIGKKIIRHLCPEEGLVLDPFAGTGTTGQAVLELNKEYGHSRCFILIEEGKWKRGSVEEVTANRLERVITGEWASGKREPTGGELTFYSSELLLSRHRLAKLGCTASYAA